MLLKKIDNDLKDFPKDLRDFIYSIDVTMPLNDIFNKLFSFFEVNMKKLKCFDPCGTVYCGFTLQDIKEPIFDCLASSFYLYLEEQLLVSKDRKTQRELIYMDDNEENNPDPSKRISRNKSMVQKKCEEFYGKFGEDYYNSFSQILNLESNAIIRSVELSHFLFANSNIRFVNEYISQRFDLRNYNKLSHKIRDYIKNPPSYSSDIPVTPGKFLAIDFENTFHTSLFNQINKYLFYIYNSQNNVPLKTEGFLFISSWFSRLPPYWLKETATSNTIIDKICKYIMTLKFLDAASCTLIAIEDLLNMVHYPLEVSLTYLLCKKYKLQDIEDIKDTMVLFLNDVKKANLKIYNDSLYLNQFKAKSSDRDFKCESKHPLLVHSLAMQYNYIDFKYNEYNMFYVLGDISIFDFIHNYFNKIKEASKIPNTYDISSSYSEYLYTFECRNNNNLGTVLIAMDLNCRAYLNNFPKDALLVSRTMYSY